jgi:asparagine synthetase B (glutamine-hydrolysing)
MSGGIGTGLDYSTFAVKGKYYLLGDSVSPYFGLGMSRTHKNIKTYSVGFDVGLGEDSTKYNVDMNIARTTAALYGTDHHEIFLSSADALASFEEVVWHMDEPISNPTAWALFALSKATKASATVVLSGDGGDELFGGYEIRFHRRLCATGLRGCLYPLIKLMLLGREFRQCHLIPSHTPIHQRHCFDDGTCLSFQLFQSFLSLTCSSFIDRCIP